jgi:L-seryl-tRNA(Ser) seleniumtransferase
MATSRRKLLESLGVASLLGYWPFPKVAGAIPKPTNIYQALGIRPLINFRGTPTAIGASKQWPELHKTMAEASKYYVDLDELQDQIGSRLASLIGSESAMVTTGAAGAINLGTCACLTGTDPEKIHRLPDLTGMKNEVVVQEVHRNGYDHAVRNAGVKIIEVEDKAQLLNAAGERTAMMYYLGGTTGDWAWETPVPLEECLAVGRKVGFPVMVDAANMLPPWENIRKLAALKTDLICISGGKHMRGPQCTGILAGRKDLILAARLNSNPHSDSLGRPLKVGREEMVGVWLAAEKYSKLDFSRLEQQSFEQAEYLLSELRQIPELEVDYVPHDRTRRVYRVLVRWDEQKVGLSANECEQQLLAGDPRIAVLRNEDEGITFTVFMNDPGEEKLAASRMKEIFSATRLKR